VDTVHLYSLGIPRVINLLCEHSLVNAFAEQQRPIQSKIVEDVAREFQLDEVEPIAPNGGSRIDTDVYNSEAFIQTWARPFPLRLSPSTTTRQRK